MKTIAIVVTCAALGVVPRMTAQPVVYRNLPIASAGVTASTMDIYLENEILVPSLVQQRISDADITAIRPYPDSPETAAIVTTLKAKPNLTLGHALPYFYVALNHTFMRIYRNSVLMPREGARERAREFGLEIDLEADGPKNLRDLIPVQEMRGQHMRVEIYFSHETFTRATQSLKLHGAQAFWDPSGRRMGLFVDGALFRWLPHKATWGDQSPEQIMMHVRDYVVRRTIAAMGHEIFHLVQHAGQSPIYRRPFIAEASAVYVQQQIAFREEMFQIAGGQTARGIPLRMPEGTSCRQLLDAGPPFGIEVMHQLYRADSLIKARSFDLVRLLLADDAEFYAQTNEELRLAYDIAPAFVLFASRVSREQFQRWMIVLQGVSKSPDSRAALKAVNEEFATWLHQFRERWWGRADAADQYDVARSLVTECQNERLFALGLSGARIMGALLPTRSTSLIYAGDSFWRLEIPFFAFDYYAMALARARTYGYFDEPEVRVLARLGDAYESLGDLQSAIRLYDAIDSVDTPIAEPGMLLLSLRSKLKRDFYRRLLQAGRKPSGDAFHLVNTYIHVLQMRGCPTEVEKQGSDSVRAAVEREDWAAFETHLLKHYQRVRAGLMTHAADSTFSEALRIRTQMCP